MSHAQADWFGHKQFLKSYTAPVLETKKHLLRLHQSICKASFDCLIPGGEWPSQSQLSCCDVSEISGLMGVTNQIQTNLVVIFKVGQCLTVWVWPTLKS